MRPSSPSPTAFALCIAFWSACACSKGDAPAEEKEKPKAASEPATPEVSPEEKPVPLADPNEACVKILVVAHTELEGDDLPEGTTRDRAAALAHGAALHKKLEDGEAFAQLVATDSDDARTKAKKGGMGTFTRDDWPLRYTPLRDSVFALAIGAHSEPVDTPIGVVIAERCAVDKVHSRHILIRYSGAKRATESVRRSREEAKAEASAVRAAIAGGEDFATVAKDKGEDGTAERGGDLGPIGRGMFAAPYEEAAWALAPGELSQVVETDFGFHIIQRVADEGAPSPAAAD